MLGTDTSRAPPAGCDFGFGLAALAGAAVAFVLGERLRVTAWGLAAFGFFGTLAVGLVQRATGAPGPRVTDYLAVSVALAAVALAASWRAAREAARLRPRALLD